MYIFQDQTVALFLSNGIHSIYEEDKKTYASLMCKSIFGGKLRIKYIVKPFVLTTNLHNASLGGSVQVKLWSMFFMDLSVPSSQYPALGNCTLYFYFSLPLFSHHALNTKDLSTFEYLQFHKMHINE